MECFISKNMFSKRKEDINVKAFNMITNKNAAKEMTENISHDFKCQFNNTSCNSNKKWNNKTCQCKYKNYRWSIILAHVLKKNYC